MDNIQNDTQAIALENELQQLVEEMLRPRSQPFNFPMPARPTPSRRNIDENEYLIFLQSIRDIMVMYNSNISEYNNNVGLSLQILQRLLIDREREPFVEPGPVPGPLPAPADNVPLAVPFEEPAPPTPARNNHLFSYILYRPTIRHEEANAMRRFFQNIVVRPTLEQIEDATQLIPYTVNPENPNVSCPITLEEFREGEMVRQIKHCRHTFQETAIQNWFRCNVRCPVCRYDIRDYNGGTGPRPDTTTEPSPVDVALPMDLSQNNFPGYQHLLQRIAENFASDVNNILSENIQHDPTRNLVDASRNLVFQLQLETSL
jgi:hypothetical protein